MGHEMVGRVVSLGRTVSGFRVGDLVTVNPLVPCGTCAHCASGAPQICDHASILGVEPSLDGSFAELVVAPAGNVVALGDDVAEEHGTLVEPLAVGYHAAVRCGLSGLESALIIGGGPIGQACAIGARRLGVDNILVSEPMPARRTLLESLGFATTSPATIGADIEQQLGGRPTAAIDAVGSSRTLTETLHHIDSGGRVVLVGMAESAVTVPPYDISIKERSVVGSYCYSDRHFEETAEWVGGNRPELDLLINDRRPLTDGPNAFRALADGNASVNKLILRPERPAGA
jgi:threonine dehydrogenase-like Zn-dependent dehydrogenase